MTHQNCLQGSPYLEDRPRKYWLCKKPHLFPLLGEAEAKHKRCNQKQFLRVECAILQKQIKSGLSNLEATILDFVNILFEPIWFKSQAAALDINFSLSRKLLGLKWGLMILSHNTSTCLNLLFSCNSLWEVCEKWPILAVQLRYSEPHMGLSSSTRVKLSQESLYFAKTNYYIVHKYINQWNLL